MHQQAFAHACLCGVSCVQHLFFVWARVAQDQYMFNELPEGMDQGNEEAMEA